MSFKQLFRRSLAADPDRLHFAAHSHHLWPDASYDAHLEAWNDAARLADRKWDKVMGDVWPEAQAEVAAELGTERPDAIVFSTNTHELLVRLFTALSSTGPIRVLTSDGEFHSARRQLARFEEDGSAIVDCVPVEPFDSFSERFLKAAQLGNHEFIIVSQVMFGSGHIFDRVDELAAAAQPGGPWIVIDGYHAFMAIPQPLGGRKQASNIRAGASLPDSAMPQPPRASQSGNSAFFLGGGYKYAMAGEGCAFMHAPDGFGSRPSITGWFAEFEDLSLPSGTVGFANDARRFLGATFDPSGLYRFVAVRRMLKEQGLTTKLVSDYVCELQRHFLAAIDRTPLATAELLNPLGALPHARFLAFRSPSANRWHASLKTHNCVTDVRGDVLRIGFGLYQDARDVDRLVDLFGGFA